MNVRARLRTERSAPAAGESRLAGPEQTGLRPQLSLTDPLINGVSLHKGRKSGGLY